MAGTGAAVQTRPERAETGGREFHIMLSWDEVGLVRSGLETLLQIYTRDERYGEIASLLSRFSETGETLRR